MAEKYTNGGKFSIFRIIDIVIAVLILIITFPLLMISIIISGILYKRPVVIQKRLGACNEVFNLLKIRTLPVDTPLVPTHLYKPHQIHPLAALMRELKIDELPQMINVIIGDMSLVGPRPCLPMQLDLIEARRAFGLEDVIPGITGLAQVLGVDMSNPVKLARLDARMMNNLKVRLYSILLFKTFIKIISKRRKLKQ